MLEERDGPEHLAGVDAERGEHDVVAGERGGERAQVVGKGSRVASRGFDLSVPRAYSSRAEV